MLDEGGCALLLDLVEELGCRGVGTGSTEKNAVDVAGSLVRWLIAVVTPANPVRSLTGSAL